MNTWSRCARCVVVTATVIGMLAPATALRAEDTDDELLQSVQADQQRQARRARELIDRLDLSRLQARRLVPIAERAAELHLEALQEQCELYPEMLEAFAAFAAEDSLNQGFSRECERRTARIHHRAKTARERLAEQLVSLENQARKFLTPEQRALVDDSNSGRRPEVRRPDRPRMRRHPKASAAPRENASQRRLRQARKDLNTLSRELHPHPGPLGRYLLHPFGAEALCKRAGMRMSDTLREAADLLASGTSQYPIDQLERRKADVTKLRTEINNWNLINGLYLSEEQSRQIVDLYDEAITAPKRDYAIRKGPMARGGRTALSRKELFSLEQKIEPILNSGQQQVLATYKACLIPPKNLKDPVRVGQASDNSVQEKWLDRARKLSGDRLKKHIELALDKEAEHFGQLSRAEHRQRVALLGKTARQAAKMDDVAYELSKSELAERIAPADRKQELRGEIATLARQQGEPGVISQFMLKPEFIEQLRARAQQLAEGAKTRQIDLAKAPQADNCDTSCAIDGKGARGKKTSKKKGD